MAAGARGREPRIDRLVLDGLQLGDPEALRAGEDLDGLRFERVALDAPLPGLTLLECELVECSSDRLDLRGARLLQARFTRLTAPSLAAHGGSWRDVEIIESRLGAVDVTDAEVRRVVIEGAKLGWLNLRSSQVHDVVFRNCTFDEIDLGGATVSRVLFEDCVAEKLTLTRVKATHLDLRGLDLREIEGLDGLRGAILSHEQLAYMAEAFARHLGAVVEG